jgi:Raf kinase inhibitor-like YbhB/YbcL family protein
MTLKVTSSAFESGQGIPVRFTCEGVDSSPPLQWSGVPADAQSLALICDDPDAPVGTWVHWVLYDLPSITVELNEKVPTSETLPSGAKQGQRFQTGRLRWATPPGKLHRYYFKLYALDTKLVLKPRASKEEFCCAPWRVTNSLRAN